MDPDLRLEKLLFGKLWGIPVIFDGTGYSEHHTSDGHKGMGIGLSICKAIIIAHGGKISARNHTDGAEFYFSLPKEESNYEF